jgi:hypothetical protein
LKELIFWIQIQTEEALVVQMRTKLILLILPLLLFSCSCDNCNEQKDLQCNILRYEDTQDEDPYINYKLYGNRLYIIKNELKIKII